MKLAGLIVCALILAHPAAAGDLRDPTRPPSAGGHAAAPRELAPTLSAVMIFRGERSAILNGQLVHSGAQVGSYLVEAVLEDGVRVRHQGLVEELRLPRPVSTFKKPATGTPPGASGVQ